MKGIHLVIHIIQPMPPLSEIRTSQPYGGYHAPCAVADPEENPAMASPFSLAIDFDLASNEEINVRNLETLNSPPPECLDPLMMPV